MPESDHARRTHERGGRADPDGGTGAGPTGRRPAAGRPAEPGADPGPVDPPPAALWGWSPPPRPATTAWQRRVDRLLPRRGASLVLYFAAVTVLLNLAPHLPVRAGLAAAAVAALAGGAWCALNFSRCGHAHCLVSGAGWLGLGLLAGAGAVAGHSLIGGYEGAAFDAVLLAALLFEGVHYVARGTNAVRVGPRRG